MRGAHVIILEANEVGIVGVADVDGVDREVHVPLRVSHGADRWHGVWALVGCGTIEEGKELWSEGVVNFNHIDGSSDLSRYPRDNEGLSWPWLRHVPGRVRVLDVFLADPHPIVTLRLVCQL